MGARGTSSPATSKMSRATLVASAYWGNCQMIDATSTTPPQAKASEGWSFLRKASYGRACVTRT